MLNLWERSTPSIYFSGGNITQGKGPNHLPNGCWCNYGQNYVKQIAMLINLHLQCLRGREGILVAGMGSDSLNTFRFAWQGRCFSPAPNSKQLWLMWANLSLQAPPSLLPPAIVNKILLAHSHSHSLPYCLWPYLCSSGRGP